MFDPEPYFELVDKTLSTCRQATIESNGPNIFPESGHWEGWKVITWRATIRWLSGATFEVLDLYWRRKRDIFREFHYHFMDGDRKCIFRFDTHGEPLPLGRPCHVHIGPNEEVLEDGHPKLHGFRLVEIDFLTAFSLANKHLKGKKMPWG